MCTHVCQHVRHVFLLKRRQEQPWESGRILGRAVAKWEEDAPLLMPPSAKSLVVAQPASVIKGEQMLTNWHKLI